MTALSGCYISNAVSDQGDICGGALSSGWAPAGCRQIACVLPFLSRTLLLPLRLCAATKKMVSVVYGQACPDH